mgnify:CR=1 FL=1
MVEWNTYTPSEPLSIFLGSQENLFTKLGQVGMGKLMVAWLVSRSEVGQ